MKFYLSAIAPLTMVVAVVANDNSKINAAYTAPFKGSSKVGSKQKSPNAINPLLYLLRPKDNA